MIKNKNVTISEISERVKMCQEMEIFVWKCPYCKETQIDDYPYNGKIKCEKCKKKYGGTDE